MCKKGFALVIILLVVAVLGLGVFFNFKGVPKIATPNLTPESVSPAPTPATATATPKSTVVPLGTKTPTPKPTAAPTSSSCPYNLSLSTGALKVNIRPQTGALLGDQVVEIRAQSGCKVLVNKSADTETLIARSSGGGTSSLNSVSDSSIYAGGYSIRVKYKDQWTGTTNADVTSGQQKTVDIYVSGDPVPSTPTPTPLPKPTCFNPVIYPSATGTAPFSAVIQPGGSAGSTGGISGYDFDFTGDGDWDVTNSPNAQNYTYQNSGSYSVKIRTRGNNGQYSDTCQTTVTVN